MSLFMSNKGRLIFSFVVPLLLAMTLDYHLLKVFAARWLGHMSWNEALHATFDNFSWNGYLLFFAFRSIPYVSLATFLAIISILKSDWYRQCATVGIISIISAEVFWTWDLVACFYDGSRVSSTTALGYFVTPIFVFITVVPCITAALAVQSFWKWIK